MMKRFIHLLPQDGNRLGHSHLLAICSYLLAAVLLLGSSTLYAQTCTPGPGLAHWDFDGASDQQIDNSSGIASSGGGSCVGKVLKRTDGGSNSTYVSTVGNVDSDYGPVCSSRKSICTGSWDSATPFVRYISVITTFDKGIKGKLTGISFCELALARTKSGGGFNTNNAPENYQVRLRKRVNGGSWSVIWTGSVKATTRKDWTGTSSNPVPPSVWGTYNSNTDNFPAQTTNGTSTVDFEFQLSAFQNTNSSSSREIWDLDEIDIAGCCESLPCTPTSELVKWNFDNASDNQIDNSSGISPTSGDYSGCTSVLFKRSDGGSNSVYTDTPGGSSSDYGPVCASNKSICTGTWDSATPFDRYITTRVTFPSGKAGRLYGISFCEMTMNKTKSGGSFVTNNQPESYRVRLLKNGTVIWTGSVKSTTKTTWSSSSNPPPTNWGNYNSNTDNFPVQTTNGSSQVVYEFQISAYQSSNSSSAQEIWDLDEVTVFGCCDDACVTPATPTGNDAARCGPGTVNLTAAGCVGGTLNWYGAATGGTALGTGSTFTTPNLTATTTYYVSCLSGLCESGRDPAKAIVNPIPTTPTAPNVDRCGPGTVTLTATGCSSGTPVWYNAPTGGSIMGRGTPFTTTSLTATTTYYVSCSVSTGCSSGRDPAMASINPAPTAQAGSDVVTCAGTGVVLSGTATGGIPAYTYSWAPVSGLSSSSVRNPTATPSATTSYTLTVTDSNGCTSTDVVRVTVNPAPAVVASADVAVCAGTGTSLNGTVTGGTSPYTYSWSPAAGLSSSSILNPVATPTGTTTYTLTVTDANGCKGRDVVLVTVNPKPTVSTSPAATVCTGSGTVITATATGGTPAYTYAWLPTTGLSSANVVNPTATPTATTTYTVIATDSKGCTATGTVRVTVNGLPTKPTDQSFSNVCPVTTVSLASLIVAGQELYANNTHTGTPLTVAQVSSLTASVTYYLFAVSNSCYSAPATIKVTVVNCNCVNNPTSIAGTDRVACTGSVVSLTGASVGGGATQGQWAIISGGGTLSTTALTATPSSVNYTPGAGTTSVTLRLTTNDPDGGGFCTPAYDEVVITFSKPTIVVGDQAICSGSPVVLNASPSGGTAPFRYAWSPATGLSSTTVVSPTATPTATTTYTVVMTDANGCVATDVSVVTVNPKPVVNAGVNLSVCTGGSAPISASVSGGTGPYTYAWSPASGLSNAAILNPTATPAATTSYTLTVTDSKGCFGTDVVVISVNPKPVANAGSDVAFCAGGTVTLSGTATSGTPAYTYAWSPSAGLSNASIRNPIATPTATTTYTLTVTDSKGCNSTDVVLVTVNPKPVVSAGGDVSTCAGISVDLLATVSGGTAPYTYAWSPSAGLSNASILNPIAMPTATTSYTVSITDNKGCVGADVVVVTVNQAPVVTVSANVSICTGASAPLNGTVTGGRPAYIYSWAPATGLSATNILNPVATPTATTTYTLTVTDSKGCSSDDVVRVTVNPKPVVDAGAGVNICAGSGIGLSGLVSDGTAPYTYAWSPAAGLSSASVLNPTATPTATTSYTLTATDSKGCSATDAVLVSVQSCTQPCGFVELLVTPGPCNPTTNLYSISRTISLTNTTGGILTVTDGTKSTTVTVTASMTSVSYSLTGLVSGSGSHTVVATLAGCGTISATYVAPASCSVCSLSLVTTSLPKGQVTVAYSQTITATGGTKPYNFSVSAGTLPAGLSLNPTTGVISGTPTISGTYPTTLVVTDARGCSVKLPVTVFQIDLAPQLALAIVVNSPVCNSATSTYVATGTVSLTNSPAGSLTITDNGAAVAVISVAAGQTTANFSLTGISNGPIVQLVTAKLGTLIASTGYTKPASCTSGAPNYAIAKTVNQKRVEKGGIVTYTISLTNTGNVTGTNIVVGDQLSSTEVTFVGNATASVGTFLPLGNSGNWNIASLGAGQVATLSFQVQINEEGLTYNTATAPNGQTVTACLTVPIHVCDNLPFEFELSAPASYSTYQWSRNGMPIAGATSAVYNATAVGEYTVATTSTAGCADGTCCPLVIVADPAPSLTAVGVAASCTGGTPLNNASITLVKSSSNAVSYNISAGSSFGTPLFASAQPLSGVVGGLLISNQANPAQAPGNSYTIRVYAANGCYSDVVVVVPPAQCVCPPAACVPFVVKKVVRR